MGEPRMRNGRKWAVGGAIAVAVVVGGTGIGLATTSGDADTPLAGPSRERAVAAALAETGGGTVTETEVGDDGAAYSVEVRLADGRTVEVNLDEGFQVIDQEADDDSAGDTDAPGDE